MISTNVKEAVDRYLQFEMFEQKYGLIGFVCPVFGRKCGYDSYPFIGYTYEVIKKEGCNFMDYYTLNSLIDFEDDDDMKEYIKNTRDFHFKTKPEAEIALLKSMKSLLGKIKSEK